MHPNSGTGSLTNIKIISLILINFSCVFAIGQYEGKTYSVSEFIKAVANSYFCPGSISIFYSESPLNRILYSSNLPEDYATKAFVALSSTLSWTVEISSEQSLPLPAPQQEKIRTDEAVLIFLGVSEALPRITNIIKTRRVLGQATKFLIFIEKVDNIKVLNVLKYVWNNLRAINSYVVNFNTTPQFYYLPFFNHSRVELQNEDKLFRDQIKPNLHKFNVKLLALDRTPYVFQKGRELDGVSVRIVRTIASSLNIPLDVEMGDVKEDFYQNYNGTEFSGFIRILDAQEADIVCGMMTEIKARFDGADVLPGFMGIDMVWYVKKPKLNTGWKGLVLEFEWRIWVGVATSWFITSLVIYIYHSLSDFKMELLQIMFESFGIIIESPPIDRITSFRRLLWLFLLYSIVISTAYKSVLMSTLIVPGREKGIQTIDEGMEAGYSTLYYSAGTSYMKSMQESEVKAIRAAAEPMRRSFLLSTLGLLQEVQRHPSAMALLEYNNAQSIILQNFTNENGEEPFYVLKERFWPNFNNIYMSPAHPLLPLFSKKQLQINQAGLVDQWLKEINHDMFMTMIAENRSPKSSRSQITVAHLSGVFFVFCLLIVLSILVFVIEMAYYFGIQKQV